MTDVLSQILNKLIDWQLSTWLENWRHRTVAYGTRVAMRANLGRCDTEWRSDAEGCRRQFYSYLWSVSVIPPQSWWTIAAVASQWSHWDKKVRIMALFGSLIMTVNGGDPPPPPPSSMPQRLLFTDNSLEPMRALEISHVNLCPYETIQKNQAKSGTLFNFN